MQISFPMLIFCCFGPNFRGGSLYRGQLPWGVPPPPVEESQLVGRLIRYMSWKRAFDMLGIENKLLTELQQMHVYSCTDYSYKRFSY